MVGNINTSKLSGLNLKSQIIPGFDAPPNLVQIQTDLLRHTVGLARTAKGSLIIKATLREVLDQTQKLVGGESGSLFLMDANACVTESVLASGPLVTSQKQSLLGKVMDKGLAGWVVKHHKMGVIADTRTDDRWLQLPNQRYQALSVLAMPFLRGNHLLGIVTVTHSEAHQFTTSKVAMLSAIQDFLTLIIENAMALADKSVSAESSASSSH